MRAPPLARFPRILLLGGAVACGTPDAGCPSSTCAADTDPTGDTDTDRPDDTEVVDAVVVDTDTDASPGDTDVDTDTDLADTDTGTPSDPCLQGGPALRLGTGALAFEPVTPGSDVAMVHGPQNGWHVYVSFEADHVPQFAVLEWRLLITSTGTVITSEDPFRHRVALVPRGSGSWACLGEYPGERAYLDFAVLDTDVDTSTTTTTWEALCGVGVTLEGAVRLPGSGGGYGRVLATDSVSFRLQPDPYDGPPCP